MRAACLIGPQTVRIEEVPIPSPGPHQVRFRVEGCGVCASNLGPWLGLPWTQYPMDPGHPGHEGWGTIDRVGPGVTGFSVGDRIAAISHHAYAEYDLADEHAVTRIPSPLSATPVPGEPLGCALNICERSRVERDHTVAIIGIGFLGAILTRLYSRRGARVIAISKRPFSLTLARSMGASETIELRDHDQVIEQVRALTDGEFCPRVIEATGKPWPLDLAAEIASTRGTLVIAGYHQDGPRQVNMQLWNWKGLDVINAHERDTSRYVHGMRRALSAIEAHELDPVPLYTHRFRLEDLGQALQAAHDRPDGFIKALVMP